MRLAYYTADLDGKGNEMLAVVRTFVAIELDDALYEPLTEVQERLRLGEGGRAGRWVNPRGIHLTLKFLGDVPQSRLEAIQQAVACACRGAAPFTLTLGGLGCFPNARYPRVVWVGVRDASGRLALLQNAVEGELERLGFPREQRSFQPHLTLARIKEGAAQQDIMALGSAVARIPSNDLATMRVGAVSVMKSDLRPEGAVYTELYRIPLVG